MSTPARQPRNGTTSVSRISGVKTEKRSGGTVPSAPGWATDVVFQHTRTVAWEGTVDPLRALSIFPAADNFLASVALVRRQKIIAWEEAVHPLDKERVKRQFSNYKQVPFDIEYRLVDINGAFIWVRHSVIETVTKAGRTLMRGFVRDIQTEKELELESLRVSEREQNRIGQDLHDDLCQVLAGLSCLMCVMESRIASKAPEEIAGLAEINKQIVDAMHRTRALTHGLFPGKIQIADVRGALLELASQVQARFQVGVTTRFVGRFPHHSTTQIIQIYRLAQEAMSNAIKHGCATQIDVRLEAKNKIMSLTITDNGTGLAQKEPSENGVGMHIMQYRTSTLGGEFLVRNGAARGVIVTLQYPFQH